MKCIIDVRFSHIIAFSSSISVSMIGFEDFVAHLIIKLVAYKHHNWILLPDERRLKVPEAPEIYAMF